MIRTLSRLRKHAMAIALASSLAMLACDDSSTGDPDRSIDAWAERYCSAATQLDAVVVSLPFFLSDLSSFEQAREDLEQSVPLLHEATNDLISELDSLQPPAVAVEFHEATTEYRLAQLVAIEAMLPVWRNASSFQGVEAAAVELRSAIGLTNTRMALVALPSEVRAAFSEIGDCGSLVAERM